MEAFWRGGGRPLIKRQTSVVMDPENDSPSKSLPNHSLVIDSANDAPASPDSINKSVDGSDRNESDSTSLNVSSYLSTMKEATSSASSVSDDAGSSVTYPVVRLKPEEVEKQFYQLDNIMVPILSSYYPSDRNMCKCAVRRKFYTQTYMHYPHSISLGRHYGDLARMLRSRAVMQLTRDYVMRIGQIQSFIYTLQRLSVEEHALLLQKRRSGQHVSIDDSRLECLVSICDDMRNHIAHWTSLTNKFLLNDWLKGYRWRIIQKLQELRKHLHFLMQVAVWWLSHLIASGLHVFAITPYHQIPDNILWNITRGVEEFGITLELARSRGLLKQLHNMGFCNLSVFNPQTTQSNLPVFAITQPSLARLLCEISKSRSTLVAELIYEIFSSNDTIVELLNLDKHSDYKWSLLSAKSDAGNEELKDGITIHLMQKHISSLLLYVRMEENFATQILTSLSTNTNMLRKTNLRSGSSGTPSYANTSRVLSISNETLSRFKSRRTSEASNYFQEAAIIKESFLRPLDKLSEATQQQSENQSNASNEITSSSGNPISIVVPAASSLPTIANSEHTYNSNTKITSNDPGGQAVVPSIGSGPRKPRKSVKWNDSATSSAINHFKSLYLNLLWSHLAETLYRMFREPGWCTTESSRYSLGDIRLLSTTAIMFVSKSLFHLSNDDNFSDLLRTVIQYISKRVQLLAVNVFTDQEFRRILVSTCSEKLVGADEVCLTTKLLVNAIKPSISLAESITRDNLDQSEFSSGISESLSLSTNLWLSHFCCSSSTVLTDNLIECSTVIGCYSPWFASQITQSTLNWNVQCYVNLAHVDLMIVKELVSRQLLSVECLFGSPGNVAMAFDRFNSAPSSMHLVPLHMAVCHLKNTLQTLHLLSGESEKLWLQQCNHLCHNYWKNSFPLHKVWRLRSLGVVSSTKPQEYAQRAILNIVEPVARAAATLRVNSQVKILGSVLKTLFQTWMNYILENRVKFSVVGAYQLSVDFDCIQKWVASNYCHLDPEAVNQLKDLQIFKEANAVIGILQDESPIFLAPELKTKSANSLIEPSKNFSPTSSSNPSSVWGKERITSGTTSAPILREWDTNSSPSLDHKRKTLSSGGRNQKAPIGGFFVHTPDGDENSIATDVSKKSQTNSHSGSSCLSTSQMVPNNLPGQGFLNMQRQEEWNALRANNQSLCPGSFPFVPFLCADLE